MRFILEATHKRVGHFNKQWRPVFPDDAERIPTACVGFDDCYQTTDCTGVLTGFDVWVSELKKKKDTKWKQPLRRFQEETVDLDVERRLGLFCSLLDECFLAKRYVELGGVEGDPYRKDVKTDRAAIGGAKDAIKAAGTLEQYFRKFPLAAGGIYAQCQYEMWRDIGLALGTKPPPTEPGKCLNPHQWQPPESVPPRENLDSGELFGSFFKAMRKWLEVPHFVAHPLPVSYGAMAHRSNIGPLLYDELVEAVDNPPTVSTMLGLGLVILIQQCYIGGCPGRGKGILGTPRAKNSLAAAFVSAALNESIEGKELKERLKHLKRNRPGLRWMGFRYPVELLLKG